MGIQHRGGKEKSHGRGERAPGRQQLTCNGHVAALTRRQGKSHGSAREGTQEGMIRQALERRAGGEANGGPWWPTPRQ